MQHSSVAGPGQRPGVDLWPACEAKSVVVMHTPIFPLAVHEGGGVQHSSVAGPGQWPDVDV